MSLIKKILLVVLILIIAIQFIRPARNESGQPSPADISKIDSVPGYVQAILKTSCYDCHSNHTNYPWYSRIQPVGWWLASHIKDGKEELNFSEFGQYSIRRQRSKLFAITKSIEDGTMPLRSYTLVHSHSRLTAHEKALLINWANQAKDSLSLKN
jgi:hypothetical protein